MQGFKAFIVIVQVKVTLRYSVHLEEKKKMKPWDFLKSRRKEIVDMA